MKMWGYRLIPPSIMICGTVVNNADSQVELTLHGSGSIVGENSQKAESGIAAFMIKGGETPGVIQISASGKGFKASKKDILIK